jgi:hypothetical protein
LGAPETDLHRADSALDLDLPWVLALGMALASSPALAQSDAAEKEARARFQEGKELYPTGKVDETRLKFLQACAVLKDDVCTRNLAVAEFFSGHHVDAYPRLEKILASGVLKSEPDVEREFQRMRDESYAKIGHLDVQAPPGAQIRIDDAIDAGNAPLKELIRVTAGKHVISVQVETKIEREEIDCAAGKVVKVDFMQKFGFTTGGQPPGGEEPKKVDAPGKWPVVIGLGAGGVIGIAIGIGLGAASDGKKGEIASLYGGSGACSDPNSSNCAQVNDARSSQSALATGSVVSYVIGGVLIAGAAVTMLLWPKKASSVGVVPTAGPQGAGLLLHGTF